MLLTQEFFGIMRRQGQYGDASANSYGASQMHHNHNHNHHMAGQSMETKSGNFEGRLEAFTPERENSYPNSKPEGQWRWESDESKMSNSMPSHMYNEGECYSLSPYDCLCPALLKALLACYITE